MKTIVEYLVNNHIKNNNGLIDINSVDDITAGCYVSITINSPAIQGCAYGKISKEYDVADTNAYIAFEYFVSTEDYVGHTTYWQKISRVKQNSSFYKFKTINAREFMICKEIEKYIDKYNPGIGTIGKVVNNKFMPIDMN